MSLPQGSLLLWNVHMSQLGSRLQVQTRHSTHTGAGGLARGSPALQVESSCFSPQVEPGVVTSSVRPSPATVAGMQALPSRSYPMV